MFALLRKRPSDRRAPVAIAPIAAFRAAPHVFAAAREGRVILLDSRRERYLGFDDVGSAVWTRVEAGRTVEEIASELAREYEADPERIQQDVAAFLAELSDAGLIVPA